MIAGIGGASLGTELLKCLVLAGNYEIFGCDVSRTAFGLYDSHFTSTFHVQADDYVKSVIGACRRAAAPWLVPGGDQPMVLLGRAQDQLADAGIKFVANAPDIIAKFSDKATTFKYLTELGFPVPRTIRIESAADLDHVGMPCIIKPSTGSGGSAMVSLAGDAEEAMSFAENIIRAGGCPIAQEYIDLEEGEFTVGILSLPNGALVGSIALRRSHDAKLSIAHRGRTGIVSSGYTQGYIADFPSVRAQAEAICRAVGNRGAMNIQGRVRNGTFIPFEINPRFSASTYLRAMAGFNEIDLLLRNLASSESGAPGPLREGWYLRSFTEMFVSPEDIKT